MSQQLGGLSYVAPGALPIGVVRRIDSLGRIGLPLELRRIMSIDQKDPMEIFVGGEQIVLRKYQPTCAFCGNEDGGRTFRGKNVCADCLASVREVS